MIKKLIVTLSFCLLATTASATDLLDVYRDALNNDPIYKAAVAQVLSSKEAHPQARADLLPALFAHGEISRKRIIETPFGADILPKYIGEHDYLFTLTQPIFDYSSIRNLMRSHAVVKQADAVLRGAQQDLIVRIAAAYFNVLEAGDNVRFTGAEKRALYRQLDQATQRYKVGLDAITSVYDAQASYDAVVAREISTKNELINNRENLRKISGTFYPKLAKIITELPLRKPNPSNVEKWVQSSEKYNNELRAARFAAEAANQNIEIKRGGHMPIISFVGRYENRNLFDIGFTNRDSQRASAGVQMDLPIFEGGLVLSQTRQAKYDYQRALANLDSSYKNAIVSTRQFYNNIISGISVVKADRQGVISAQSSEESNQAAYRVGTRTIVDVLLAQRALYNAQRQLAADQYKYLNDILALKNAAGILSTVDLEEINTWLKTLTAHTTVERFKIAPTKPLQKLKPVTKPIAVKKIRVIKLQAHIVPVKKNKTNKINHAANASHQNLKQKSAEKPHKIS